jgi:predicted MPP superfamily phosphohydrolase
LLLSRRHFIRGSAGILTAGIAGSMIFGFDNARLEVRRVTLPLRNLPVAFDGYTLVQISDLHVRWLYVPAGQVRELLEDIRPDLVVCTGDFVNHAREIPKAIDYLRTIQTHSHVVTVLGNNDHDNFDAPTLQTFTGNIRQTGATLLMNESIRISRGRDALWIVGLDDPMTHHARPTQAFERVEPGQPRLVLAHSTNAIPLIRLYQPDVLLAGHTHGGQVRFPLIGPVIPVDDYSRRGYFEGYRQMDGMHVYINRGLGCNIIPLRVNCPPEITVITLKQGQPEA